MPRARKPSPQSNRVDTLTPEAPTAVPNQPYGEAGQQLAAQRQIPLAGAPTLQGAGTPPPQTQPNGAPAGGQGDMMAALQAHVAANGGAGARGVLTRPTERPDEPVTHGLPMGAGAGPEALTGIGALARQNVMGQATLGQLLSNLAAEPGAPSAVQDLASRALSGVQ